MLMSRHTLTGAFMNFSFNKTLSTLVIGATLLGSVSNAMALDSVLFIPKYVNNRGEQFEFTDNAARGLSNAMSSSPIEGVLLTAINVVLLPFAILSADSSSVSVNQTDLQALGYTSEEISAYEADVTKLQGLFGSNSFSSKEEVLGSLESLNLGVVASEQLKIK
jgi:hypothetical protein